VSDFERDGWRKFAGAAKKPPPEHGIKIKKAGTTWWGQRWIEALEQVLRGHAGRLQRGRTYARAGRTHDLVALGGKVTAKVTGSRSEPYEIAIELAQLADSAWDAAIAGMAAKAQFSAELLAGQMPQEIDQVFRAAGTSLFPKQRAELRTDCSCPDWGDPCKHVAATHYVLGEALDRDPFLLFELRGRSKDQVLDALRAARSSVVGAGLKPALSPAPPERTTPSVAFGKVAAGDYDRPREPLPALHFSFDAPLSHGAVLRQLGTPAAWNDSASSPADALAPLIQAAAESARRIALSEPQADATSKDAPREEAGREPAPSKPPTRSARKSSGGKRRAKKR
jgi:uncharacterized Zn finger protein